MQADDPISFMQLTAKNEMTSKEDQFQLSLLAAMGNTQRKEAADPLASKLNKVHHKALLKSRHTRQLEITLRKTVGDKVWAVNIISARILDRIFCFENLPIHCCNYTA